MGCKDYQFLTLIVEDCLPELLVIGREHALRLGLLSSLEVAISEVVARAVNGTSKHRECERCSGSEIKLAEDDSTTGMALTSTVEKLMGVVSPPSSSLSFERVETMASKEGLADRSRLQEVAARSLYPTGVLSGKVGRWLLMIISLKFR